MSRIGRQIIAVPDKVNVSLEDGVFSVTGPLGTLAKDIRSEVSVNIADGQITLNPNNETGFANALWGTYASHIKNMITGVTEGFTKKLIIEGVGFKVALKGDSLELDLGFSHPIIVKIPADITVVVEKNSITISGFNKESVGEFSAKIRAYKKTEPYKGKGIRYEGEVVRRKQGKKTVG